MLAPRHTNIIIMDKIIVIIIYISNIWKIMDNKESEQIK